MSRIIVVEVKDQEKKKDFVERENAGKQTLGDSLLEKEFERNKIAAKLTEEEKNKRS